MAPRARLMVVARSRCPACGSVAVWLAILGVVAELGVSANLLTLAGVPYVTEGGPPPLKLHPGTVLIVLAFGLGALGRWQRRAVVSDRWLAVFFGCMAICLVDALVMTGTGNLVVLLDSFLPAGLLAGLLCWASARQLDRLRHAMVAMFALNAALALAETAAGATLIPLYLNDIAYRPVAEDFRPTALYDHPLTGGAMSMLALALLAPRRGRDGGALRVMVLVGRGLIWTSLIAFGGRMAVGVSLIASLSLAASRQAGLVLRRDRRAGGAVLAAAAAMTIGLAALIGVAWSGLGSRLIGHLYWDQSAQARLSQWQLLGRLNVWQVLFGTKRDDLLAQLNPLRLATGVEVIENFWLLMFVALGLAGFAFFVAGLVALLGFCWQRTDQRGRMLILSVLVVASSSNSLGRKSGVLVCLVAAVACRPNGAMARPGMGLPAGTVPT